MTTPQKKAERLADSAGAHLTKTDIAERIKITVRTLDRWIEQGIFPPPDRRPTKRTIRWWLSTVERWEGGRRSA